MKTTYAFMMILAAVFLWRPVALADLVHFKDGRKLEGEVTEEGGKVKIKTRFGEYSFARSQISKIVSTKSDRQVYEEKRAAVGEEDALGHYALAMWCKLKGMEEEMKANLVTVIVVDPDHELAHKALGHRLVNGKWLTEEEAKAAAKAGTDGGRGDWTERGGAAVDDRKIREVFDSVQKEGKGERPRKTTETERPTPKPEVKEEGKLDVSGLSRQALKAVQEKRYEDAIKLYSECLKLRDGDAGLYYSRGYVYSAMRQTDEALADLNKCLELQPSYANALFSRAMLHFQIGEMKMAVADLEAVLKLDPGNRNAAKQLPILRLVAKGPDWERKFTRTTPHYVVTTNVDQKLTDRAAYEMERIYKEYAAKFRFKGDEQRRRFNVRVFATQEGFSEYAAQTTGTRKEFALGYYAPMYKELILWHQASEEGLIDTLYHEGFHQFLDYFISDAPAWFNEGLAQYFETAKWVGRGFKLGRSNPDKLQFLKRVVEVKAYVPFKALLQMSHPQFMSQDAAPITGATMTNVHYVQSWSFIHFLIHSHEGKYKWVIRDLYQGLKAGKKSEVVFEAVFGAARFARIEEAWIEYAKDLKY